MTKTELEKAIKNGESVWINGNEHKLNKYYFVAEYNNEPTLYLMTCGYEEDDWDNYLVEKITNICRTKAEAEHYLHHANVTRTDTLPFLTWEEFDKGNRLIRFTGKNGEKCSLDGYQRDDKQSGFIHIVVNGTGYKHFDYTEKNFYLAYDECVRLFKGD